ncbi:LPS translocon maturation chaperone LptM [Allopusillimonas ginsengisoli]|uniref:LPS translocon maturation chaperone LptM n=1 Tax=Allopusillimonas ginsengisoli TaxID=453575 RepID=UPI001021F43C|nr:lipoprotein [Allopusillimonas ginsengisoli]TEA76851.1 hypothetical protein ERE07_17555 [Allopusillimonas ginsengisoli]
MSTKSTFLRTRSARRIAAAALLAAMAGCGYKGPLYLPPPPPPDQTLTEPPTTAPPVQGNAAQPIPVEPQK